jgi:YggT family protein
VRSIWQALNALTEPLLRRIRRWMPDLGGIDISPVVLILACAFVQSVVLPNIAKLLV